MISNFTRSSSVVFDAPLLITGRCVRQCLGVILTLILVNPMTSLVFAEDSQPNYVVLPVEVRKAEVRVVEQVPPSISIPPHVLAPFVGRPLLMDEMSGYMKKTEYLDEEVKATQLSIQSFEGATSKLNLLEINALILGNKL